jgi:GH43 family beta-xylosidase
MNGIQSGIAHRARIVVHAALSLPNFIMICFAIVCAPLMTAPAQAQTGTFANPVFPANAADPSVFYKDGFYYFAAGTDDAIWIYKSPTLEGIAYPVAATKAFTADANYSQFWAVEITYVAGDWYLTTGSNQAGNNRHIQVLKANSQDPMGSWTNLGRLTHASIPGYDLDAQYFTQGGNLYLTFSGAATWANPTGIYIMPMTSPFVPSGNAVRIAEPGKTWNGTSFVTNASFNWEGTVLENPAVVINGTRVNLAYSANAYDTNSYATGLMTYTTGSILSPGSWTKETSPVAAASATVFGPGGMMFTKSPNGTQDWAIYHAKSFSAAGALRQVLIQPVTLNGSNKLVVGTLQGTGVAQNRPSGEVDTPLPSPTLYNAEYATINGGTVQSRSGALSTMTASGIDATGDYVQFSKVNVPTAGTYKMIVRYSSGTGVTPTYTVQVNGGTVNTLNLVSGTDWNVFRQVTTNIALNAGDNVIKIGKGTSTAELDAITLPRQEAEFSRIFGGAVANVRSNAQVGYDVGSINWPGSDGVEFGANNSILTLVAGNQTVSVHYSAGWGAATQKVSVNGGTPVTISYAGTTDWNTFGTATVTLNLPVGLNTVKFTADTGYAEIDSIEWSQ